MQTQETHPPALPSCSRRSRLAALAAWGASPRTCMLFTAGSLVEVQKPNASAPLECDCPGSHTHTHNLLRRTRRGVAGAAPSTSATMPVHPLCPVLPASAESATPWTLAPPGMHPSAGIGKQVFSCLPTHPTMTAPPHFRARPPPRPISSLRQTSSHHLRFHNSAC
jgi:hypothetical protein